MKNSKGSAFEREVCKRLSMWYSKGASPDWFWRTSNSGGRATVASRKRSYKGGHGDIGATCSEGESLTKLCCFELKRGYPMATSHELLDNPSGGQWKKFILQAKAQAKKSGCPHWVLITKRDRKKILITSTWDFFDWAFDENSFPDNEIRVHDKKGTTASMLFEDFLSAARPEIFHQESIIRQQGKGKNND